MCGIFGINISGPVGSFCWMGNHFNQHRGQRYSGIAYVDRNGEIRYASHRGRVGRFPEEEAEAMKSHFGIGHVSLQDRQPYALKANFGSFAIAFDGKIINLQELIEEMGKVGRSISLEQSTVEMVARLIGEGNDIVDGIKKMNKKIKGSFSLVILTPTEIFAARCSHGFRPLVLGRDNEKDDIFAISSESRALQNMGMHVIRDVNPGEIVKLDESGFKTVAQLPPTRFAHCAFEWAYIASIDSIIDGIPVITVRHNLGAKLAATDKEKLTADFCSPIPMSGIGHAEGYSLTSKLPNVGCWLYNRYADRSYTPLDQDERDHIADIKLSVIEATARNKKIVIVDDSIVRGTQIREQIKRLKNAGAKKIHLRIACPPLIAPCDFGISTTSYDELIATKKSVKEICNFVESDSLIYNTLEDFVNAIGLPASQLCLKCWTNESPLAV